MLDYMWWVGDTKIARKKGDVPNNKEIPRVGPYVQTHT